MRISIVDVFIHTMFLSKSCHVLRWFYWKESFLTSVFSLGLLDSLNLILWVYFWFYCLIFFPNLINHIFPTWHRPKTMSLATAWNLALPGVQWHVLMEPVDETQNASRHQVKCHSLPGGPVLVHCRCHPFQMPKSKEQDCILCFKVGGQFVQSRGPLDCET